MRLKRAKKNTLIRKKEGRTNQRTQTKFQKMKSSVNALKIEKKTK